MPGGPKINFMLLHKPNFRFFSLSKLNLSNSFFSSSSKKTGLFAMISTEQMFSISRLSTSALCIIFKRSVNERMLAASNVSCLSCESSLKCMIMFIPYNSSMNAGIFLSGFDKIKVLVAVGSLSILPKLMWTSLLLA